MEQIVLHLDRDWPRELRKLERFVSRGGMEPKPIAAYVKPEPGPFQRMAEQLRATLEANPDPNLESWLDRYWPRA